MQLNLAICAQIRNETPYLVEWIEFHRMVGVEHFYLYDHYSTDNPGLFLREYIDSGVVTLIDWSEKPHPWSAQMMAHDHCLANFGPQCRWIAFIDVDEFLFSPKTPSMIKALEPYEGQAGVFVHWVFYGSSGHVLKPPGLVIEEFTRRAPIEFRFNLKGKTIVNPTHAVQSNSAHYFIYRDGHLAVTENMEPVVNKRIEINGGRSIQNSITDVSVNVFRLHHYCIRSWEEFLEKSKTPDLRERYSDSFFANHDRNEVHDPVLHSYLPLLKLAVKAKQKPRLPF